MNDVQKLDQPCSCPLVEVVVEVSYLFILVSEPQSDNCPLLVCKLIAHTASRLFSHLLASLADVTHYPPLPQTNMRALAVTWKPQQTLYIDT